MMIKPNVTLTVLAYFFVVLCFFISQLCQAEWSFTAKGSTNYIYRSYSKSNDGPSLAVNVDYEHESGLFLGASAATVDFNDSGFDNRSFFEFTPYLGFSWPLNDDLRVESRWVRYIYNDDIFGRESDYNEFYFFLHYKDLITSRISFSENFWNQNSVAADYELIGRYPITDSIRFSAGIGYSQTKSALEYDYLYWNAGFSWFFHYVAFDLRYVDSHQTSPEENGQHNTLWQFDPKKLDSTAVFSISVGF